MVFGPVGQAHFEKRPLHHRHLITNCWTLVHWMLRGPFAGVTPLACLHILPPQSCCCLGLLLNHFHCPKPVQISSFGKGTCLSYVAHSWQCWLRNRYSVWLITKLEQVVTNWNGILFQLFCGWIFYRPVWGLFLYTELTVEIITKSGVFQFDISISAYVWLVMT